MLPAFDEKGQLPPGYHNASWDAFLRRFGYTEHRMRLIDGMADAIKNLRQAGCSVVYIDGSFVTDKYHPADYDGCWDETGVDSCLLDPILLNFDYDRGAQKLKYKGEFFPASSLASRDGIPYKLFFQIDRKGCSKGIVKIDPGEIHD